MDCEKLKNFLNEEDVFCRYCGIRLTEAAPGKAEAVMEITPEKYNSRNVVQGGAIFTLCDLTAAGASNSRNDGMIAMGGNITYIRPGTGKKLRAVARELNRGKRTGLLDVDVFNDEGKLVAHATINGFATGEPLLKE